MLGVGLFVQLVGHFVHSVQLGGGIFHEEKQARGCMLWGVVVAYVPWGKVVLHGVTFFFVSRVGFSVFLLARAKWMCTVQVTCS